MKVRQLLSLAILFVSSLSLVFLSSCGEDEEVPPEPATILLSPDLTTFEGVPGDVIETQVSVSAPAGLISVTINKTVGTGSPSEYQTETPAAGENQLIFDFSYTLQAEEVGETLVFDIIVEDESSPTSATKSFTVETNSPPARAYTTVLLYVPLGDLTATSFFSTNTGLTYSPEDVTSTSEAVSPNIDFGYYYGVDDESSLASPLGFESTVFAAQVAGWNTKNDIAFRTTTLGSSEFNELSTFADIDEVFDGGTDAGNIVSGLAVGDVFAFETDASKEGGAKRGVLIVSAIDPGFDEGNSITIDVLVQETPVQ